MIERRRIIAMFVVGVASLASSTLTVSANPATRLANVARRKCKAAIEPKHLTGDAYKAEMAKCADEGDAYK